MLSQQRFLTIEEALFRRLQFLIQLPRSCNRNLFESLMAEFLTTADYIRYLNNTLSEDKTSAEKCKKIQKFSVNMEEYLIASDLPEHPSDYSMFVARNGWIAIREEAKKISRILKQRHATFRKDYSKKPVKEIQKSIKSFEKQIVLHEEKISNPSKFIEDWDAKHPKQKVALTTKIWPQEIEKFKEQKNILELILKENK